MIRIRPKTNGILCLHNFQVKIKTHKNQVWYAKPMEKGTWEIGRDNVYLKVSDELVEKEFVRD